MTEQLVLTGRRLLAKDLCVGTLSSDSGSDQYGGNVELHIGFFFVELLVVVSWDVMRGDGTLFSL